MKKTLIALMALAGVAMADTTTITAAFTDTPVWKANFYSDDYELTFTLDESYTIENSGSILAAYWGSQSGDEYGANAIVLSASENGTLTLSVGRGGLSNLTNSQVTSETTFTFGTGNAPNGKPSMAVFKNAIQLGITYTLTVTGADHYNVPTLTWNGGSIGGDDYSFTGNMSYNADIKYSVNPGVAVVPSIPDTPSVPEPATATLSLLALAGLASRRRH